MGLGEWWAEDPHSLPHTGVYPRPAARASRSQVLASRFTRDSAKAGTHTAMYSAAFGVE
jgi:hypothetical protein